MRLLKYVHLVIVFPFSGLRNKCLERTYAIFCFNLSSHLPVGHKSILPENIRRFETP